MKRCLAFLRSVLPADPKQLCILLGVLCLFMAPSLRWAPRGFHTTRDPGLRALFALAAIRLSGCAGLFVCFRPGTHPFRRLVCWVCMPAGLGLAWACSFYLYAATSPSFSWGSIGLRYQARSPLVILSKLGPGFHYALMGFVLVAAFTARVGLGSSSVPLALPKASVSCPDDTRSWRHAEVFLWVLLALLPMIGWIFPFVGFVLRFMARIPVVRHIPAIPAAFLVTDSIWVLLAISVMGREAWRALRRSLRLPPPGGVALAVAFPLGIAALIWSGQLLSGLIRWAANYTAALRSPHLSAYFHLPSIGLLWLLPAALTEEIVFRGILQPRFIRRYGVLGGIFLVGVVFAAAHIPGDLSLQPSLGSGDGSVALLLVSRLTYSLGLSFVTGWLTLRTRSALPAAVAHGLMNVLASTSLGSAFPGVGPLMYLLWAGLAYMLFRYWPAEMEAVHEEKRTATIPVPAR